MKAVAQKAELKQALMHLAAPRELLGDDYATPDRANGQCRRASRRLARRLVDLGIEARLVECKGFLGDVSRWHHWYANNGFIVDGAPTEKVEHWMVRVGDAYLDLTARQFFPDAGYPQVYSEKDLGGMWADWEDHDFAEY